MVKLWRGSIYVNSIIEVDCPIAAVLEIFRNFGELSDDPQVLKARIHKLGKT